MDDVSDVIEWHTHLTVKNFTFTATRQATLPTSGKVIVDVVEDPISMALYADSPFLRHFILKHQQKVRCAQACEAFHQFEAPFIVLHFQDDLLELLQLLTFQALQNSQVPNWSRNVTLMPQQLQRANIPFSSS